MRTLTSITAFAIILLMNIPLFSQAAEKNTANNAKMPVDPNITVGTLDNGMRYYIRQNKKPENRAELRLALDAGSILEDDDQQGLAHFVEHMAFNGTKNFHKQALVDYLESVGMRFGPDLNAYTSFDETVYMLQIATDSSKQVETAFKILSEWAHLVEFQDEEIDKERGVVIEEWRRGRGANARMRDKQYPLLFKNSRYAERLPIGKKDILENFSYETLRRYYKDWYRPDLMAIIAVGDFDKAEIEKLIHKNFAGIPASENPRERVLYDVPDHPETIFAIASDPEATRNEATIYFKRPLREDGSEAAYRQSLVENLYSAMFNSRLDELRQQSEPPFLYAYSGGGAFRTKEFYVLGAGVQANGVEAGLEAVLTEAKRVQQFGFTQSELDRQKTDMMRGMERAYNERDKTQSRRYAAEYIRNFLENEPIPGIEYELELYQKFVPSITLEEVNQLSAELISEGNRVVMVSVPEKEDILVPTEEGLQAVFDGVREKSVTAYVDAVSDDPLIEKLPPAGKVANESFNEALGLTEWQLSNGICVFLKPTDFKNDQVLMSAYSPGGTSLVSDEDYIPAITATAILSQSGLGNFSQVELSKKLTGKVASVSPSLSSLEEGFSGSASPQDAETMFQLIHLYFTAPRLDSVAYEGFRSRMADFITNRDVNPASAFRDTISTTLSQGHYRSRPWSAKTLEEMNLQRSYEIYRERFADAGDFTFFFVGNIDLANFKKFSEQYLASLPALERKETWKDQGIRMPDGVIKKQVRKGLEEKSQVSIIYNGPFEWNRQNRYDLSRMANAFQIKLREILREEKGGTYSVGVRASTSRYPEPDYTLRISFGCAPDRVEELTATVFQQIDSLRNFGSPEKNLQKVQEMQRRSLETNLQNNGYWLRSLENYDSYGEDPMGILKTSEYIESLTLEAINNAAKKYFDPNRFIQVVLYPENFQP